MGKRVNPTLIGAFVLGALGIAIMAIAVLSSGKFFAREHKYILFFTSDVNGLKVGAPVKFRGVEIGSVSEILLSLGGFGARNAQQGAEIRIPVIIQLDSRKIMSRGAEINLDDTEAAERAVQQGLRGQLNSESLLTGLLYINLDMLPNTPVDYYLGPNAPYPEIPTDLEQVQTALTHLINAFEKVDFDKLVTSLTNTSDSVNDLMKSGKLRHA